MACRALSSVLLSSMIAVVFAGCDNSSGAPLVTAPNAPTSPANGAWNVDRTIVKSDGSCFSRIPVGPTFGNDWDVILTGSSIWLDEGVHNWPTDDSRYEGMVDHLQFTARRVEPPPRNPLTDSVTLSGTFNSTFTAFEATETETFTGPGCPPSGPDLETETLESHLVGARR